VFVCSYTMSSTCCEVKIVPQALYSCRKYLNSQRVRFPNTKLEEQSLLTVTLERTLRDQLAPHFRLYYWPVNTELFHCWPVGYTYPLTKASSEHDVLCTGTWYIRSFDTCYTGWVKKTDTFAANLNNKGVSFFDSPCIIINNWYTVYSLANNELIDSKPAYYNFSLF
jgi:hypothetical protein